MLSDNEKKFIDAKIGFIKKTIKGLQHYDNPCGYLNYHIFTTKLSKMDKIHLK